ncbi:efflux RND transporter permease subunit [Limibacter armeniacum]|uniref:efflux RND transporter permease subunit n=1 Tax=Limibacter armeniacum TaxID=466084 RepID=UPI002FE59E36
MRKLIEYFIKFPLAVNLVMVLIVFFGFIGASRMNSNLFPNSPKRNIMVEAVYPGASPEEVEEGVVLKIEENLKGVTGLERLTSVSSENSGQVTVEMISGTDMTQALADVENAVNRISSFPTGVESIITYKQENTNFVINFGITGDKVNLHTLKENARKIEKDLMAIRGISKVSLSGFPDEEIVILLDESAMQAYNLTFQEVAAAVSEANLNLTGGSIKDGKEEFFIRVKSKGYQSEELDHLVIRNTENGGVIRLKDVAEVKDQWKDTPTKALLNGNRTAIVTVSCTYEEDVVNISSLVKDYINNFNQENELLEATVIKDMSVILQQRLDLLTENGIMGIVLVLVFLSLFLNPRIAFWVAGGIPISILGMFIIISYTAVTINMITLFAMIVVLGILVDDAIVIAENIYQHYEKGKTSVKAAIDGTMEVIPAVLSAVLTTMVAFSAFIFLDGNMGDFFSEMSMIVISILFVSLIEGLIILPGHIAHSKALKKGYKKSFKPTQYTEDAMRWAKENLYRPAIIFLLRNKLVAICTPTALFMIAIGMIAKGYVGVTFFPYVEGDDITLSLQMPTGTQEEVTSKWVDEINKAINEVDKELTANQPEGRHMIQQVSESYQNSENKVQVSITLLDAEVRTGGIYDVINGIQQRVPSIPGAEKYEFVAFSPFGKPFALSLNHSDISSLSKAKEELKQMLTKIPELRDIADNTPVGSREIHLQLKEKANLLGISLQDVIGQVRQAFFGLEVQRLQRGQDEVRVWVRYKPENRNAIGQLEDMKIRLSNGNAYPLSEIATLSFVNGYSAINHLDFQREVQITAELTDPDASVPEIIKKVNEKYIPELQHKYPGLTASYDGQKREQDKVMRSAKVVLPVVMVLMLAIVIFTLRSVSQSILVFAMIPFSFIGVIIAHWIHSVPICIISFLGVIALVGVVVNDSLVLINALNINLKQGMKYVDALVEAGASRFRPILLTSLTTIAGMGPMVFEKSLQARFLVPMVVTIAYGILAATLATLFVLPVLLTLVNKLKVLWASLKTGKAVTSEEVESAIKEIKYEYTHEEV